MSGCPRWFLPNAKVTRGSQWGSENGSGGLVGKSPGATDLGALEAGRAGLGNGLWGKKLVFWGQKGFSGKVPEVTQLVDGGTETNPGNLALSPHMRCHHMGVNNTSVRALL